MPSGILIDASLPKLVPGVIYVGAVSLFLRKDIICNTIIFTITLL